MVKVTELLHVSLLVADLERARAFYEGVLGLAPSPARPQMDFPGVWYDIGPAQIHLLALPSPDPAEGRPAHGGRDRHTALAVADLDAVRQALERAGIAYTLSRSGRRALFVRDPDGNALELVEPVVKPTVEPRSSIRPARAFDRQTGYASITAFETR